MADWLVCFPLALCIFYSQCHRFHTRETKLLYSPIDCHFHSPSHYHSDLSDLCFLQCSSKAQYKLGNCITSSSLTQCSPQDFYLSSTISYNQLFQSCSSHFQCWVCFFHQFSSRISYFVHHLLIVPHPDAHWQSPSAGITCVQFLLASLCHRPSPLFPLSLPMFSKTLNLFQFQLLLVLMKLSKWHTEYSQCFYYWK